MVILDINNTRYACRVHQRDENLPWLLMLHGFMGDHRVFNHIVDRACEFCNPITPDLLGFGKSGKPANPKRYNEDHQISDLCELVELLDVSPLFLHGYSMGGRLALKVALENDSPFQGLILESSNCGISDPIKRKERRKTDAQRAEKILHDYADFLEDWQKLDLFKSPRPVDKNLQDRYKQIQSEQAPPALANSLAGFGTGTMSPVCDTLHRLKLPVLVMAGSADDKYQRISSNLVNRFTDATFSSIPASHRIHLDNPESLLEEIETFIASNNPL